MKQFKDIKNKLKYEDYYDPTFDWGDYDFYYENKLTEDFIREFKDKVDWFYISLSQELSEKFIKEFQDKVNWEYISEYQELSGSFKEEFKKELCDL